MPFLLILVGAVLIILNLKAIKKESTSFKAMVKNSESNITDFDVAIGELRREFSETILELQQEIYELKEKLNSKEEYNNNQELIVTEYIKEEVIIEEKETEQVDSSNKDNNVKVTEIGELLKQGISLDDICEKYNIGKGEVLLIKELYLR